LQTGPDNLIHNTPYTIEQLAESVNSGHPALASIANIDGTPHAVVVERIEGDSVRVTDPGNGKQWLVPIDEFKKQWSGWAITTH
jgi:ABC-type bacteriocin/lantibiotic exporter with double-glycine peptidase domain